MRATASSRVSVAECRLFHGQDLPKFKADSTLVLIPVSVTEHSNRFVLGLRKQDFQILEDGVEQKIVNLSGEDAPLSIGSAL